jgi:hypothetical protein
VTELSLRGCLAAVDASLEVRQRVQLKMFHAGEYFESGATVAYMRPSGAAGLVFNEMKPHCRAALQRWILVALDKAAKSGDFPPSDE